jgi:hypothetical protein
LRVVTIIKRCTAPIIICALTEQSWPTKPPASRVSQKRATPVLEVAISRQQSTSATQDHSKSSGNLPCPFAVSTIDSDAKDFLDQSLDFEKYEKSLR